MREKTITDSMPRVTPETLVIHANTQKVKLYVADNDLALEIQEDAAPILRQLTVQEILREAIHEGLPLVQKRYRAAVDAAAKVVR